MALSAVWPLISSSSCHEVGSPTSGTHLAFGLSSHSDLELLIGQLSDSRRADLFSKQLAQLMKRLSVTLIPTSRILSLLCASSGWSLIDMRGTCAVLRESDREQ